MYGWIALVLLVTGYDTFAIHTGHQTMSSAARKHRVLTGVGFGVLAAHLIGRPRVCPPASGETREIRSGNASRV